MGYHLARRGLRFIILDAAEHIGDSWRKRWDSLRLFTPARFDGLDGMPFPGPPGAFPTKDEMADYLQSYAARFDLPVRSGVTVTSLTRRNGRYVVKAAGSEFESDQVVVAMANYQDRRKPAFAGQLSPEIVQVHSSEYRKPSQLKKGAVLIVGAGNSGSEIGLELSAAGHPTIMSGPTVGNPPFRMSGPWGLFLARFVLRFIFHRVLTIRTPMGRKARPKILSKATPLIRVWEQDLVAAGIKRVPRIVGVENGLPKLEDGRVVDVASVVWCTGYHADFSWIDLPILGGHGEPRHRGGVVENEPGLYFVGLHFLYAMSSTMIHGVGRDAARIVKNIAARKRAATLPAN